VNVGISVEGSASEVVLSTVVGGGTVEDAEVVVESAALLEESALKDSLVVENSLVVEDSLEEEEVKEDDGIDVSSVALVREGRGVVLDVTVSCGGGVSISTTVEGSGVLVAGLRDVTTTVGSGASVSFSVRVTWASLAGRRFVTVAPSEARVSIYVALPRVFVLGVACPPTIGSHALGPIVVPSCWTTVGCLFR
jgi:hypothetical protein